MTAENVERLVPHAVVILIRFSNSPATFRSWQSVAISVGADFEKLAPQEKTKGARDVRGPSGPTGLRYLNRRRFWLSVADLAG
jgi:hypothetical protein